MGPDSTGRRAATPGSATQSIAGAIDERLVTLLQPQGLAAEQYRAIRTGLLARWRHRRHLVHTITSSSPQEGKSITGLNLGLALRELEDRSVIVIEADLRRPQFRRLLGLPPAPGLAEVLRGKRTWEQVTQRVGKADLHVITAGDADNAAALQLLGGGAVQTLLNQLRRCYDHVIIDTPPVLELADAGIVGAVSDEVLLVVRVQRTPRSVVQQAVQKLASYNAPVAGLIATDERQAHSRAYGYSKYWAPQKRLAA